MFCDNCGTKLEANSKFCGNCGKPPKSIIKPHAPVLNKAKPPLLKSKTIYMLIGLFFIIAVCLIVLYAKGWLRISGRSTETPTRRSTETSNYDSERNRDNDRDRDNDRGGGDIWEYSEPAPLPPNTHSFDEIVAVQSEIGRIDGNHFYLSSGNIQVYGSFDVRHRNNSSLAEDPEITTYFVCVEEVGTNVTHTATFNYRGYVTAYADHGVRDLNNIIFDGSLVSASEIEAGGTRVINLNHGPNFLVVSYNNGRSAVPNEFINLYIFVFTPQEAIRYAEQGILPESLQGLTVTGLDSIFRIP